MTIGKLKNLQTIKKENEMRNYKPNEIRMLILTNKEDCMIDCETLLWYLDPAFNLEKITKN